MAKFASPVLQLSITEEDWESAVQGSSGSCLIADAIKKQYPHLSNVAVDMATVRVTDRKKGLRYMYLTPDDAQTLLLAYDQGWSQPAQQLTLRKAVKTSPVTVKSAKAAAEQVARLAELDEKVERGEKLTTGEKQARTKLKRSVKKPRPVNTGPSVVGGQAKNVVHGRASKQGPAHPNLLRGRSRFFGAKVAKPAEVFQEAVDKASAERVAELEAKIAELEAATA